MLAPVSVLLQPRAVQAAPVCMRYDQYGNCTIWGEESMAPVAPPPTTAPATSTPKPTTAPATSTPKPTTAPATTTPKPTTAPAAVKCGSERNVSVGEFACVSLFECVQCGSDGRFSSSRTTFPNCKNGTQELVCNKEKPAPNAAAQSAAPTPVPAAGTQPAAPPQQSAPAPAPIASTPQRKADPGCEFWCAGCGGFCGDQGVKEGKTCIVQQKQKCEEKPCWDLGTCTQLSGVNPDTCKNPDGSECFRKEMACDQSQGYAWKAEDGKCYQAQQYVKEAAGQLQVNIGWTGALCPDGQPPVNKRCWVDPSSSQVRAEAEVVNRSDQLLTTSISAVIQARREAEAEKQREVSRKAEVDRQAAVELFRQIENCMKTGIERHFCEDQMFLIAGQEGYSASAVELVTNQLKVDSAWREFIAAQSDPAKLTDYERILNSLGKEDKALIQNKVDWHAAFTALTKSLDECYRLENEAAQRTCKSRALNNANTTSEVRKAALAQSRLNNEVISLTTALDVCNEQVDPALIESCKGEAIKSANRADEVTRAAISQSEANQVAMTQLQSSYQDLMIKLGGCAGALDVTACRDQVIQAAKIHPQVAESALAQYVENDELNKLYAAAVWGADSEEGKRRAQECYSQITMWNDAMVSRCDPENIAKQTMEELKQADFNLYLQANKTKRSLDLATHVDNWDRVALRAACEKDSEFHWRGVSRSVGCVDTARYVEYLIDKGTFEGIIDPAAIDYLRAEALVHKSVTTSVYTEAGSTLDRTALSAMVDSALENNRLCMNRGMQYHPSSNSCVEINTQGAVVQAQHLGTESVPVNIFGGKYCPSTTEKYDKTLDRCVLNNPMLLIAGWTGQQGYGISAGCKPGYKPSIHGSACVAETVEEKRMLTGIVEGIQANLAAKKVADCQDALNAKTQTRMSVSDQASVVPGQMMTFQITTKDISGIDDLMGCEEAKPHLSTTSRFMDNTGQVINNSRIEAAAYLFGDEWTRNLIDADGMFAINRVDLEDYFVIDQMAAEIQRKKITNSGAGGTIKADDYAVNMSYVVAAGLPIANVYTKEGYRNGEWVDQTSVAGDYTRENFRLPDFAKWAMPIGFVLDLIPAAEGSGNETLWDGVAKSGGQAFAKVITGGGEFDQLVFDASVFLNKHVAGNQIYEREAITGNGHFSVSSLLNKGQTQIDLKNGTFSELSEYDKKKFQAAVESIKSYNQEAETDALMKFGYAAQAGGAMAIAFGAAVLAPATYGASLGVQVVVDLAYDAVTLWALDRHIYDPRERFTDDLKALAATADSDRERQHFEWAANSAAEAVTKEKQTEMAFALGANVLFNVGGHGLGSAVARSNFQRTLTPVVEVAEAQRLLGRGANQVFEGPTLANLDLQNILRTNSGARIYGVNADGTIRQVVTGDTAASFSRIVVADSAAQSAAKNTLDSVQTTSWLRRDFDQVNYVRQLYEQNPPLREVLAASPQVQNMSRFNVRVGQAVRDVDGHQARIMDGDVLRVRVNGQEMPPVRVNAHENRGFVTINRGDADTFIEIERGGAVVDQLRSGGLFDTNLRPASTVDRITGYFQPRQRAPGDVQFVMEDGSVLNASRGNWVAARDADGLVVAKFQVGGQAELPANLRANDWVDLRVFGANEADVARVVVGRDAGELAGGFVAIKENPLIQVTLPRETVWTRLRTDLGEGMNSWQQRLTGRPVQPAAGDTAAVSVSISHRQMGGRNVPFLDLSNNQAKNQIDQLVAGGSLKGGDFVQTPRSMFVVRNNGTATQVGGLPGTILRSERVPQPLREVVAQLVSPDTGRLNWSRLPAAWEGVSLRPRPRQVEAPEQIRTVINPGDGEATVVRSASGRPDWAEAQIGRLRQDEDMIKLANAFNEADPPIRIQIDGDNKVRLAYDARADQAVKQAADRLNTSLTKIEKFEGGISLRREQVDDVTASLNAWMRGVDNVNDRPPGFGKTYIDNALVLTATDKGGVIVRNQPDVNGVNKILNDMGVGANRFDNPFGDRVIIEIRDEGGRRGFVVRQDPSGKFRDKQIGSLAEMQQVTEGRGVIIVTTTDNTGFTYAASRKSGYMGTDANAQLSAWYADVIDNGHHLWDEIHKYEGKIWIVSGDEITLKQISRTQRDQSFASLGNKQIDRATSQTMRSKSLDQFRQEWNRVRVKGQGTAEVLVDGRGIPQNTDLARKTYLELIDHQISSSSWFDRSARDYLTQLKGRLEASTSMDDFLNKLKAGLNPTGENPSIKGAVDELAVRFQTAESVWNMRSRRVPVNDFGIVDDKVTLFARTSKTGELPSSVIDKWVLEVEGRRMLRESGRTNVSLSRSSILETPFSLDSQQARIMDIFHGTGQTGTSGRIVNYLSANQTGGSAVELMRPGHLGVGGTAEAALTQALEGVNVRGRMPIVSIPDDGVDLLIMRQQALEVLNAKGHKTEWLGMVTGDRLEIYRIRWDGDSIREMVLVPDGGRPYFTDVNAWQAKMWSLDKTNGSGFRYAEGISADNLTIMTAKLEQFDPTIVPEALPISLTSELSMADDISQGFNRWRGFAVTRDYGENAQAELMRRGFTAGQADQIIRHANEGPVVAVRQVDGLIDLGNGRHISTEELAKTLCSAIVCAGVSVETVKRNIARELGAVSGIDDNVVVRATVNGDRYQFTYRPNGEVGAEVINTNSVNRLVFNRNLDENLKAIRVKGEIDRLMQNESRKVDQLVGDIRLKLAEGTPADRARLGEIEGIYEEATRLRNQSAQFQRAGFAKTDILGEEAYYNAVLDSYNRMSVLNKRLADLGMDEGVIARRLRVNESLMEKEAFLRQFADGSGVKTQGGFNDDLSAFASRYVPGDKAELFPEKLAIAKKYGGNKEAFEAVAHFQYVPSTSGAGIFTEAVKSSIADAGQRMDSLMSRILAGAEWNSLSTLPVNQSMRAVRGITGPQPEWSAWNYLMSYLPNTDQASRLNQLRGLQASLQSGNMPMAEAVDDGETGVVYLQGMYPELDYESAVILAAKFAVATTEQMPAAAELVRGEAERGGTFNLAGLSRVRETWNQLSGAWSRFRQQSSQPVAEPATETPAKPVEKKEAEQQPAPAPAETPATREPLTQELVQVAERARARAVANRFSLEGMRERVAQQRVAMAARRSQEETALAFQEALEAEMRVMLQEEEFKPVAGIAKQPAREEVAKKASERLTQTATELEIGALSEIQVEALISEATSQVVDRVAPTWGVSILQRAERASLRVALASPLGLGKGPMTRGARVMETAMWGMTRLGMWTQWPRMTWALIVVDGVRIVADMRAQRDAPATETPAKPVEKKEAEQQPAPAPAETPATREPLTQELVQVAERARARAVANRFSLEGMRERVAQQRVAMAARRSQEETALAFQEALEAEMRVMLQEEEFKPVAGIAKQPAREEVAKKASERLTQTATELEIGALSEIQVEALISEATSQVVDRVAPTWGVSILQRAERASLRVALASPLGLGKGPMTRGARVMETAMWGMTRLGMWTQWPRMTWALIVVDGVRIVADMRAQRDAPATETPAKPVETPEATESHEYVLSAEKPQLTLKLDQAVEIGIDKNLTGTGLEDEGPEVGIAIEGVEGTLRLYKKEGLTGWRFGISQSDMDVYLNYEGVSSSLSRGTRAELYDSESLTWVVGDKLARFEAVETDGQMSIKVTWSKDNLVEALIRRGKGKTTRREVIELVQALKEAKAEPLEMENTAPEYLSLIDELRGAYVRTKAAVAGSLANPDQKDRVRMLVTSLPYVTDVETTQVAEAVDADGLTETYISLGLNHAEARVLGQFMRRSQRFNEAPVIWDDFGGDHSRRRTMTLLVQDLLIKGGDEQLAREFFELMSSNKLVAGEQGYLLTTIMTNPGEVFPQQLVEQAEELMKAYGKNGEIYDSLATQGKVEVAKKVDDLASEAGVELEFWVMQREEELEHLAQAEEETTAAAWNSFNKLMETIRNEPWTAFVDIPTLAADATKETIEAAIAALNAFREQAIDTWIEWSRSPILRGLGTMSGSSTQKQAQQERSRQATREHLDRIVKAGEEAKSEAERLKNEAELAILNREIELITSSVDSLSQSAQLKQESIDSLGQNKEDLLNELKRVELSREKQDQDYLARIEKLRTRLNDLTKELHQTQQAVAQAAPRQLDGVSSPRKVEYPRAQRGPVGEFKQLLNRLADIANFKTVMHSRRNDLDKQNLVQSLHSATAMLRAETGSIVYLDNGKPTLVISDLHARRDFLQNALNTTVNGERMIDLLEKGEVNIVLLGDAMHSEDRTRWGTWRQDSNGKWVLSKAFQGSELDGEMVQAIGLMRMIMELKSRHPQNFHYLRGNHDDMNASLGIFRKYSNESVLVNEWMNQHYGQDVVKQWVEFEQQLPLIAVGTRQDGSQFVMSHAAPGTVLSGKDLDHKPAQAYKQLAWTDNNRISEDFLDQNIRGTLTQLGLKEDAQWIIGHRDVARGTNYRSQLGGQLIQINDKKRQLVYFVPASGELNPDRLVASLNDGQSIPDFTGREVQVRLGPDQSASNRVRIALETEIGRRELTKNLDRRVSRIHFKVEYKHGAYTLTDLKSLHGTRVNSQNLGGRVSTAYSTQIAVGDVIAVGDSYFIVDSLGRDGIVLRKVSEVIAAAQVNKNDKAAQISETNRLLSQLENERLTVNRQAEANEQEIRIGLTALQARLKAEEAVVAGQISQLESLSTQLEAMVLKSHQLQEVSAKAVRPEKVDELIQVAAVPTSEFEPLEKIELDPDPVLGAVKDDLLSESIRKSQNLDRINDSEERSIPAEQVRDESNKQAVSYRRLAMGYDMVDIEHYAWARKQLKTRALDENRLGLVAQALEVELGRPTNDIYDEIDKKLVDKNFLTSKGYYFNEIIDLINGDTYKYNNDNRYDNLVEGQNSKPRQQSVFEAVANSIDALISDEEKTGDTIGQFGKGIKQAMAWLSSNGQDKIEVWSRQEAGTVYKLTIIKDTQGQYYIQTDLASEAEFLKQTGGNTHGTAIKISIANKIPLNEAEIDAVNFVSQAEVINGTHQRYRYAPSVRIDTQIGNETWEEVNGYETKQQIVPSIKGLEHDFIDASGNPRNIRVRMDDHAIMIVDNGKGMPASVIADMFVPQSGTKHPEPLSGAAIEKEKQHIRVIHDSLSSLPNQLTFVRNGESIMALPFPNDIAADAVVKHALAIDGARLFDVSDARDAIKPDVPQKGRFSNFATAILHATDNLVNNSELPVAERLRYINSIVVGVGQLATDANTHLIADIRKQIKAQIKALVTEAGQQGYAVLPHDIQFTKLAIPEGKVGNIYLHQELFNWSGTTSLKAYGAKQVNGIFFGEKQDVPLIMVKFTSDQVAGITSSNPDYYKQSPESWLQIVKTDRFIAIPQEFGERLLKLADEYAKGKIREGSNEEFELKSLIQALNIHTAMRVITHYEAVNDLAKNVQLAKFDVEEGLIDTGALKDFLQPKATMIDSASPVDVEAMNSSQLPSTLDIPRYYQEGGMIYRVGETFPFNFATIGKNIYTTTKYVGAGYYEVATEAGFAYVNHDKDYLIHSGGISKDGSRLYGLSNLDEVVGIDLNSGKVIYSLPRDLKLDYRFSDDGKNVVAVSGIGVFQTMVRNDINISKGDKPFSLDGGDWKFIPGTSIGGFVNSKSEYVLLDFKNNQFLPKGYKIVQADSAGEFLVMSRGDEMIMYILSTGEVVDRTKVGGAINSIYREYYRNGSQIVMAYTINKRPALLRPSQKWANYQYFKYSANNDGTHDLVLADATSIATSPPWDYYSIHLLEGQQIGIDRGGTDPISAQYLSGRDAMLKNDPFEPTTYIHPDFPIVVDGGQNRPVPLVFDALKEGRAILNKGFDIVGYKDNGSQSFNEMYFLNKLTNQFRVSFPIQNNHLIYKHIASSNDGSAFILQDHNTYTLLNNGHQRMHYLSDIDPGVYTSVWYREGKFYFQNPKTGEVVVVDAKTRIMPRPSNNGIDMDWDIAQASTIDELFQVLRSKDFKFYQNIYSSPDELIALIEDLINSYRGKNNIKVDELRKYRSAVNNGRFGITKESGLAIRLTELLDGGVDSWYQAYGVSSPMPLKSGHDPVLVMPKFFKEAKNLDELDAASSGVVFGLAAYLEGLNLNRPADLSVRMALDTIAQSNYQLPENAEAYVVRFFELHNMPIEPAYRAYRVEGEGGVAVNDLASLWNEKVIGQNGEYRNQIRDRLRAAYLPLLDLIPEDMRNNRLIREEFSRILDQEYQEIERRLERDFRADPENFSWDKVDESFLTKHGFLNSIQRWQNGNLSGYMQKMSVLIEGKSYDAQISFYKNLIISILENSQLKTAGDESLPEMPSLINDKTYAALAFGWKINAVNMASGEDMEKVGIFVERLMQVGDVESFEQTQKLIAFLNEYVRDQNEAQIVIKQMERLIDLNSDQIFGDIIKNLKKVTESQALSFAQSHRGSGIHGDVLPYLRFLTNDATMVRDINSVAIPNENGAAVDIKKPINLTTIQRWERMREGEGMVSMNEFIQAVESGHLYGWYIDGQSEADLAELLKNISVQRESGAYAGEVTQNSLDATRERIKSDKLNGNEFEKGRLTVDYYIDGDEFVEEMADNGTGAINPIALLIPKSEKMKGSQALSVGFFGTGKFTIYEGVDRVEMISNDGRTAYKFALEVVRDEDGKAQNVVMTALTKLNPKGLQTGVTVRRIKHKDHTLPELDAMIAQRAFKTFSGLTQMTSLRSKLPMDSRLLMAGKWQKLSR
jgi:pSer/pThr/pTyr-binding forkhead associated (FHA) protein